MTRPPIQKSQAITQAGFLCAVRRTGLAEVVFTMIENNTQSNETW
jgi:hypothetical protein